MNFQSLIDTTILFFIVMDPMGNVPLFIAALGSFDAKKQRKIIMREMVIALGAMFVFFFFGSGFFSLFGLSSAALQIAGGVILMLIAMPMLFAPAAASHDPQLKKEPFIVPLAIPAVAGPGILALISLYGGGLLDLKMEPFLAIVIAWVLMLPIMLGASLLKKFLGQNGLVAIERLSGYIIILIGAEMAIKGVQLAFSGH